MRRSVLLAGFLFSLPFLASAASCPALVRGASGPAVSAVQKVLFATYKNFPQPTGYFGPTTEAAVKQWQSENGIEAVGSVGPKTAAAMGVSLCATPALSLPNTPPAGASSPGSPNQSLIDALLAQVKVLQAKLAALLGANPSTTTTNTDQSVAPQNCSAVTPPQCAGGALSWRGNDTNGCSLGYDCARTNAAACGFAAQTIANGSSVTAYASPSVPFGKQCLSEQRICTSGTLSGSYQASSCAVSSPENCSFNGKAVAHGAAVTGYQSATVPYGSQCLSQIRICSNGTLSGTYQNSTCTVQSGSGSVATVAALRALAPGAYTSTNVQGYYSANDGGGGTFTWSAGSQSKDDGGAVIAPANAGSSGRWIRTIANNSVSPEMFGAKHDSVTNDAPTINAAVNALASQGGGTVQLSCNVTYSLSNPTSIPYYNRTMKVEIVPRSGVSLSGCGPSSVIRLADNVNQPPVHYPEQLFGAMVTPIFTTDPLSNATFSNFTIGMNGTNNDCNGTCFTWSAVLGSIVANNVTVDNVTILNNPGSNDIQFGDPSKPSASSNVTVKNSYFSYGGYAVNPAAFDYSAIWLAATNSTISNNTLEHGSPPGNPKGSGAAIEIHGSNILATGNTISDYWSGANIGNLSGSSDGLKFNGNTVTNVSEGVLVWVQYPNSTQDHVEVSNNSITLNAGFPKAGIDLWENLAPATPNAGTGQSITINGNTIFTPLSNSGTADRCAIDLGPFNSITVTGNTITNSPGPAICGRVMQQNGALYINGNTVNNSGTNASGPSQSAIWMPATQNLPGWLAIKNNAIDSATFGIWGALNVAAGEIGGNTIVHTTTPIAWTGSGMSILSASTPDDQRKKDLQTLASALQSFYTKHGSYAVPGGIGGTGLIATDGSPTIIQALAADGDLSSSAPLPTNPANANDFYMLYICNAGKTFALSAKLDGPSSTDIAKIQSSCNGTGANGTYSIYGRNYAVGGSNGVITP